MLTIRTTKIRHLRKSWNWPMPPIEVYIC